MARSSKPNRELKVAQFADPPNEFRPMPFWGLNDSLDDEELRRQIREMKAGGWGGFFVHPRYGMETPYLTDEYMSRMRTIANEARTQGLEMWIYDEHPFPAGCSGGLVGAESRENRHRVLVNRLHSRLTPIEEGVAYFSTQLDHQGVPAKLDRITDPATYAGSDRAFLHFYQWEMPVAPTAITGLTNEFIHGFPYTDLLNPEAVKRFIDVTYDRYRSALGDEFGKTIKGTFSDIPVYQWHYATPRPSIPWTDRFPEYFESKCGYDLVAHLPSLFYDIGDFERVRRDYWWAVNQLFLETYTKQVHDWCRRNGLIYTAHYWGEETLHWQIPWTGDVMTHFAHLDYPGTDHILRNIEDPLGIKQVATVAEQLDRPRTVSETYALCGHNLTFEERKWIGDWEYALGANFIVPYIPAYSMRGRRKRDEPPSEFVQQPYWTSDKMLNDYFARLGYALTRGTRVVDLLVLQPLQSAWTKYRPGANLPPAWRPGLDAFDGVGAGLYEFSENYRILCEELLRMHRDYHVGNEELLASDGSVVDGKLRVGTADYSGVLVPESTSWSRSTIELLSRFVDAGGTVIALEPLPTRIDGEERPDVLPKKTVVTERDKLGPALATALPPEVTIDGAPDVLYQHRRLRDGDLYFFANTSTKESYGGIRVVIPGQGALELWDPLTGARRALPAEQVRDGLEVRLDFAPVGSFLIRRTDRGDRKLATVRPTPKRLARVVALDGQWDIELLGPNARTLDYCEAQINGGAWRGPMPTWQAHILVHEAGVGTGFALRYRFDVTVVPAQIRIGIEDPHRYDILVNDAKVPANGSEPWWDPNLRLFNVTRSVVKGANVIEVRGTCGVDSEIEACYVVGDFSLDRSPGFRVTKLRRKVSGEDITKEGFPFFIGRVVLRRTVDLPKPFGRAYLRFKRLDAIVGHVRMNGEDVGTLAWKPYILDVTDHVRAGRNTVEVELSTSLHNLLGPHHSKLGEARHFVLQHSWMDLANWTDEYFVVPVGVSGAEIGFAKDQQEEL